MKSKRSEKKLKLPKVKIDISAELPRLSHCLYLTLAKTFVADGSIDPHGKSDWEIRDAIWEKLRRIVKEKSKFNYIISRVETILEHARHLNAIGDKEAAFLFYRILFEHWINALVSDHREQLKFDNQKIADAVRADGLLAKFRKWPKRLGYPPIAEEYLKVIAAVQSRVEDYLNPVLEARDMDEKDNQRCLDFELKCATEDTVAALQDYLVHLGRRLPEERWRRIMPYQGTENELWEKQATRKLV